MRKNLPKASSERIDSAKEIVYNVLIMKDLKYVQLFDAYGALLTEHQRELCELYYMCDLSLTEIAEEKGISKQSVSDTLAKSRQLLDEYEEKLHLGKVLRELSEIRSDLQEFGHTHPEFSDEIRKILSKEEEGEGGF